MVYIHLFTLDEPSNCHSCRIYSFPIEQGGILSLARIDPVTTKDLDKNIIMDSIPSPPCSDLVSIETLVNNYGSLVNPPLTDPLEL